MITIHILDAQGSTRSITAGAGQSLMRAAVAASVGGIAADCGGLLSCATCHVIIDATWAARLPPADADEASMLEMTAAPREPGSRLSCQIALHAGLDGLLLRLPASQY